MTRWVAVDVDGEGVRERLRQGLIWANRVPCPDHDALPQEWCRPGERACPGRQRDAVLAVLGEVGRELEEETQEVRYGWRQHECVSQARLSTGWMS